MRYTSKRHEAEARQWQGPFGETTFDELLTWGAPVRPSEATDGMTVALVEGGMARVVNKGDWIVKRDGRWSRVTDEQFRQEYETPTSEAEHELPGFETLTLRRVGFRRFAAGEWEWRHAGLTRAEVREGGWVPLYETVG